MGRPSRCPGCKELKSAHDFGRPGKNCNSPKPDVLQSLTELVQLLSTELKSLRQETTESTNSTAPCYIARTACYDRFGPDGVSTGRPTWRCLF